MKIGLISSFYEKSKEFHQDCFESVLNQTDKKFTFYLFGDEYSVELPSSTDIRIVYEEVEDLTPREIKAKGVVKAYKDNCDFLCFIDSDDFMKHDRIELLKKKLKTQNTNLLLHNYDTVSEKGKLITPSYIELNSKLLNKHFFDGKNISGFGNTIYKTSLIYNLLPFPDETMSLDWEVASVLIWKAKPYFWNKSLIGYRQHTENWVGNSTYWDEKKLDRVIQVRNSHYSFLNNLSYKIKYENNYDKLYEKWIEKKNYIMLNKMDYLNELNSYEGRKLFWWELI